MHLLSAKPGGFVDEEGIIDLEQTPANVVILSAADTTLGLLARTLESLPEDYPSVRLANFLNLTKPAALDLYTDKVINQSNVVILSLLGGASYWPYGLEQLTTWAEQSSSHHLIIIPGDDQPDPELTMLNTEPAAVSQRIWRYLREGTAYNAAQLFHFIAAAFFANSTTWSEPKQLPRTQIYHPTQKEPTLNDWQQQWHSDNAVVIVLFYRTHLQTGNTQMLDEWLPLLAAEKLNPLPIAISSLKDKECTTLIEDLARRTQAQIILNTTGFSAQHNDIPALSCNIPVLQVIMASSTEQDWQQHATGLRARDIAMHIALPELDGRIITRAISFKTSLEYKKRSQIDVIQYQLQAERAIFVAKLAYNTCKLSQKPNAEKRIAIILANYPTKDGRIGNGVGLDTPASTLQFLHALKTAQYPIANCPSTGNELIERLQETVTNSLETVFTSACWQSIDLNTYQHYFAQMPEQNQQAVLTRWGKPNTDPKHRHGRMMIAGLRLGEVFVGIQPARGFNMDLNANYHDPDLVPPHSYLAYYFWLRHEYQIDAIIHLGKHGNLEWLPGKGVALSEQCWPDIIFGPTPHFYPFIVNDPGEGAQAKRRIQAVIIDHLMPPMARAETYGELTELEGLVDEYYQAMGMDERREEHLRDAILTQAKQCHVLDDIHSTQQNPLTNEELLEQLDTYLCDIKEAQIRQGLHTLGQLPKDQSLAETLAALCRIPRGAKAHELSILTSLATDLQLPICFNPLMPTTAPWTASKPEALINISHALWRTEHDTRERLEQLALHLIQEYVLKANPLDKLSKAYPATCILIQFMHSSLFPALQQSCQNEIHNLLRGLNAEFIAPGASGAPTRGRLDTLPTGRNFYSVDNRAIPSKTAWILGQKSAEQLILRHLQEHGDYPKQIGLSVWGTSTMRTGGDDIAQAFALMGIQPIWEPASGRVIDFEIQPAFLLNRPRVDVTLRISGFFRDAFPNVIQLYDSAVRALVALEEPGNSNTIKQHIELRQQQLIEQGTPPDEAKHTAAYRIYGSKPGAYGAGLQGLIDERCWQNKQDLANAYIEWGGYAYGQQDQGTQAHQHFSQQLGSLDVVLQSQDNREHDLLDSDDYYQFQGGMTNAVETISHEQPSVYHADHSNPAHPKIRTLKEELNRVIRSRVLNPKWINGMQQHGYKGAFEMAATVDYLFAYDATTDMIDNYQYEQVTDSLLLDPNNQAFMRDNNIHALQEMSERLLEAIQRGLWADAGQYQSAIEEVLLGIDANLESK
jgi:cobaltochelatase CobN